MNTSIIFCLFASDQQINFIQVFLNRTTKQSLGKLIIHQFPDAESLVTIETDVDNRDIIFIAYLDRPDSKIFQLILAAETARKLGAKKITLIAPYLPYMRQDKQFHTGESISSIYFAKLISHYFDGLFTVDPHLHRWRSLTDIYSIPSQVLHAADAVAVWISTNIVAPILLGPDGESAQWVSAIAKKLHAPFLVLSKERFGDQQVASNMPEIAAYINQHFVLIDDIISTAATMLEAINHLKQQGVKNISCIGVHAIFSGAAYQKLLSAGVNNIISCNTVAHESNQIDLIPLLLKFHNQ